MGGLYDTIEDILMWGAVVLTVFLVIYLGYLQYLKVKRRRAHYRHRTHHGTERSNGAPREHRHRHHQRS